ncbi:MAG: hypothetical protein KDB22_17100 [Planctomycetales bacterium]|nr:hypothetical protein [Planctomycetales bacterium]
MFTFARNFSVNTIAAFFVVCPQPWVVKADTINVSSVQQQVDLISTKDPEPTPVQIHDFLSAPTAKNYAADNDISAAQYTRTRVNQFQSGTYNVSPQNLSVSLTGSNSGEIKMITATGDEASLSERLEFIFNTDASFMFSLDASIATSGVLKPVQVNSGMSSVVVQLSQSDTPVPGFVIYDTDGFALSNSATLPAGSYKLTIQSVYKVNGLVGTDASGSASYTVDFSVSAVPEPSALVCACTALGIFGFRRRNRQGRSPQGVCRA